MNKIAQSIADYPATKQQLIEGNKKSKGKGLKQTEQQRELLKEERRKLQVNNVKYDNCKIYDSDGRHIFNCNEKKA